MADVVAWLASAAVLALVLVTLTGLARRVRRRGVGQELMGPVDMIYRPHTHEINQQIRQDEQRMVARASPDDDVP